MASSNETVAQEGKYVQANGLHIYYEECGGGRPSALVLLHGGTRTSAVWQPYLPALEKHFHVITPDSRGHGRTDNPTGEMSYSLMADDIAAFVQALGLTKPLIYGKSDGGQTALEIGMRYPALTAALVAAAAWYRFSESYLKFLEGSPFQGPGAVDFERIRTEYPAWLEILKTQHASADDPERWQVLLRQISTLWWTPLNYSVEDLQKITEPILILLGDRDETVPVEQAVDMYRRIPNAELAILPHTNHDTTLSDLSTDIVLNFLLRHSVPDQEE